MEVMNDLFFFIVLGHVATKMIGDDRPYFIGSGDDIQFNQVIGNGAQIDL